MTSDIYPFKCKIHSVFEINIIYQANILKNINMCMCACSLFNEYRKMTKIFTYYKNSLQTRKSINFHKLVTNIYKKRERTLYLMTKDYFHLMAKLAFLL